MQLNKTSWIVRIAYMFEGVPNQVDRCTLWQRFCVLLIPWMLFNILVWIIAGFILGMVAHLIVQPVLFIFNGTKLVYDPYDTGGLNFIVGRGVLKKLVIFRYERKNIRWLDWTTIGDIGDGLRCPFLTVLMIVLVLSLLYLGLSSLPAVFRSIGEIATYAGTSIYNTSGWWGSGLIALLALIFAIHYGKKGYRTFAATPSGAVVVSHIKEWKQQHCIIIELV